MARLLEAFGFEVTTASDGGSAWPLAARGRHPPTSC